MALRKVVLCDSDANFSAGRKHSSAGGRSDGCTLGLPRGGGISRRDQVGRARRKARLFSDSHGGFAVCHLRAGIRTGFDPNPVFFVDGFIGFFFGSSGTIGTLAVFFWCAAPNGGVSVCRRVRWTGGWWSFGTFDGKIDSTESKWVVSGGIRVITGREER